MKRFIYLSLSLIFLTESVLRWGVGLGAPPLAYLDPVTEYELVPSAQYKRWGNTISINSHGLRAQEHDPVPSQNERRVLIIGDSVIYGGHFIDQSETIAVRFEENLSTNATYQNCHIRALPVAVSSWGPANQAAFLSRSGTLGAELAFIVVSGHDLYDVPKPDSDILPYRTRTPKTAIGDAFQAVIERFNFGLRPQSSLLSPDEKATISMMALDNMSAMLKASNATPILIYHPTVPERHSHSVEAKKHFQLWAQRAGVTFFDLTGSQIDTLNYQDAIHPDAKGAQQIASALSDFVGDQLRRCDHAP